MPASFDINTMAKLLITLVELIPSVQKVMEDLHQKGELSAAQKQAFADAVNAVSSDPAWQPDPVVPPTK